MRQSTIPRVVLSAVCAASTAALAADPIPEITVRADRPVTKIVGRSSSGAPIRLYQLSYHVSYEDLDLATAAGADALKQRLRDAADSACQNLDRLYPDIPADKDCVRKATDESMSQVGQAIERARTKPQTKAN